MQNKEVFHKLNPDDIPNLESWLGKILENKYNNHFTIYLANVVVSMAVDYRRLLCKCFTIFPAFCAFSKVVFGIVWYFWSGLIAEVEGDDSLCWMITSTSQ